MAAQCPGSARPALLEPTKMSDSGRSPSLKKHPLGSREHCVRPFDSAHRMIQADCPSRYHQTLGFCYSVLAATVITAKAIPVSRHCCVVFRFHPLQFTRTNSS